MKPIYATWIFLLLALCGMEYGILYSNLIIGTLGWCSMIIGVGIDAFYKFKK